MDKKNKVIAGDEVLSVRNRFVTSKGDKGARKRCEGTVFEGRRERQLQGVKI